MCLYLHLSWRLRRRHMQMMMQHIIITAKSSASIEATNMMSVVLSQRCHHASCSVCSGEKIQKLFSAHSHNMRHLVVNEDKETNI